MSKQGNNRSQKSSRGVYKGPGKLNLTYEDTPYDFFPDKETSAVFKNMIDAGYILSCDTVVLPQFWHNDWSTCPICGCEQTEEGHWIHNQEQ